MRRILILLCLLLTPVCAFAQATYPGALNHAEDAAHASGDRGEMCLAVRTDSPTARAGTDGDYIPLTTNSSGALYVTTTGGAPAPGYVEDAAETAGATLSMCGTVVRAGKTGSTATAGDNATVNVSTEGGLWGASDQIEDAAETAGTPLAMAGAVARTTKGGSTSTNGDNATINVNGDGGLWLAADVIEDAAETAAAPLVGVGAVVRATQVGSTATAGDNGTLNLTENGALMVSTTPSPGTLTVGVVDVAATGTAVQGATVTAKACLISCPTSNTSGCYVRMSTGNGVTGGFSVPKGTMTPWLPCTNTNIFWVDAGTNGDDVNILSVN